MSDERGSIKISTANDIGTSLVTVLGGDGYSPEEWADNINLCGIHAADIENALENIEDSTGSGSERGSFLVSIANKIGAVLNKKYNTSRGFKPKEWASAISFLEPLPERTASGAIANIRDGADKVPVKSWGISIPANLAGVNTLECYKDGKNIIDFNNNLTSGTSGGLTFSVTADGGISYNGTASSTFAYMTAMFDFFIPSGKAFTFSRTSAYSYIHRLTLTFSDNTTANVSIAAGDTSVTYTPSKDVVSVRLLVAGLTANSDYNDTVYLQTEYGSSATTYEPYTAPEVSEVDLGRTVYCGSAEVVSGSGEDKGSRIQIKERTWTITEVGSSFQVFTCNKITTKEANFNFQVEGYENAETYRNYLADKQCGTYNTTNAMDRIVIRDDDYSTVEAFLEAKGDNYIVFETTTPTPFTFDPIDPIPETEETCNLWSDVGDSTVVYRADIDSPEPNSLLGLNNSLGNSNDNNEEEVI